MNGQGQQLLSSERLKDIRISDLSGMKIYFALLNKTAKMVAEGGQNLERISRTNR